MGESSAEEGDLAKQLSALNFSKEIKLHICNEVWPGFLKT